MRTAIVSDIHGNLNAFEAVLADLRATLPDVILHGGDLAAGGARPAEVIDRVRSLGWQGVLGNTDELLYKPGSVSLSCDGNYRASYMLIDWDGPRIRRVDYDLAAECRALAQSGLPHADWIATTPQKASFVLP